MSAHALADELGLSKNTLDRRMKELGHERAQFSVPGTRARAVWCYKLSK